MADDSNRDGLSPWQQYLKRTFDVALALVGLMLSWWLILLAYLAASIDTRRNGFFIQRRVGYRGKVFRLIKIRTMRDLPGCGTTVTTHGDPRVTPLGRLLRKMKIDELPQLINVLLGQMSFVGPRPDVPGFADRLQGDDRIVLCVRPGMTGPATLKYGNEERLLAGRSDPEKYNREVVYPDKVRLNKQYIRNYSFLKDIEYIWHTAVGSSPQADHTGGMP